LKLGKRHVRRGHLAKVREEKRGWVARMREGPRFRRLFEPRGGVLDALRSASRCIDVSPRVPWSRDGEAPARALVADGVAATLVPCDALDFGGGFELLTETRRACDGAANDSPRLVALDYFVHAVQIERASRLGADAVWFVARLPETHLEELVRVARAEGLVPIVECASASEAAAARDLGVDIAAFSFRDRDHLRSVTPDALLEELGLFPLAVAVSVEGEPVARAGFGAVFERRVC
jgi:hypothetical protein